MKVILAAVLLSATPAMAIAEPPTGGGIDLRAPRATQPAPTIQEVIRERGRCITAASARYFDTVRSTGDEDRAKRQMAEDDADCAAAQIKAMDEINAERGRRIIEACRANPSDPRYYCQNVLSGDER